MAMLPKTENSFEGLPGKIPGEPEMDLLQKWLSNLFKKNLKLKFHRN